MLRILGEPGSHREKHICALDALIAQPRPCVSVSVGISVNFVFEAEIARLTPPWCSIETFDCTGDARDSACSREGTRSVSAVADVGRNLVAVPPGGEVAEGRIFARSFVKSIRSFISRGRDCMCAVLDQRLNPKRRGHRLPCDAPILFFPVSNYSVEPEDVPRVRDTGSRSGVAVVG